MNTRMPFTRPESGCGGSLCIFIDQVWKAGVNWHSFVQSTQDLMLRDWACAPQETAPTSCDAVQSWVFYSPSLQCCLQWKLVTHTKKESSLKHGSLLNFVPVFLIACNSSRWPITHRPHGQCDCLCRQFFAPFFFFFRILLNRPHVVLDLFLMVGHQPVYRYSEYLFVLW